MANIVDWEAVFSLERPTVGFLRPRELIAVTPSEDWVQVSPSVKYMSHPSLLDFHGDSPQSFVVGGRVQVVNVSKYVTEFGNCKVGDVGKIVDVRLYRYLNGKDKWFIMVMNPEWKFDEGWYTDAHTYAFESTQLKVVEYDNL